MSVHHIKENRYILQQHDYFPLKCSSVKPFQIFQHYVLKLNNHSISSAMEWNLWRNLTVAILISAPTTATSLPGPGFQLGPQPGPDEIDESLIGIKQVEVEVPSVDTALFTGKDTWRVPKGESQISNFDWDEIPVALGAKFHFQMRFWKSQFWVGVIVEKMVSSLQSYFQKGWNPQIPYSLGRVSDIFLYLSKWLIFPTEKPVDAVASQF